MKRIIVCILIAVMLSGALASCGKKEEQRAERPSYSQTPSRTNEDQISISQQYSPGINFVFKSNGDGTCELVEVAVKGDIQDKKLVIPSTSPDGDVVTSCDLDGTGYNVPQMISADDFEEKILNVAIEAGCSDLEKKQLTVFFKKYDLNSEAAQKSEVIREDWLTKYPMIEKTPVYVFTGVTGREFQYISTLLDRCNFKYADNMANTEKIRAMGFEPMFIRNLSALYLFSEIELPDTIKCIALKGASALTTLVIPDSVTSINESAFFGCTSLVDIIIPNSVTSIGDSAFSGCTSLVDIIIPNSVTSIGEDAFFGCTSLESITIPDSVMSIGDDAFFWCRSLTSINYCGTETQWNEIQKGIDLDSGVELTYNYTGE